jgi:hypothetical protein
MDGRSTIWHNSIAFGWCFDDKIIYFKKVFLRKFKGFLLKENLLLKCIVEGIVLSKKFFFNLRNVLLKWIVGRIEGDEEFDELQRQPRIGEVSHNHMMLATRGGKGEVEIEVKVGVLLCWQLFICFFLGNKLLGEGVVVGLIRIYDNTFILPKSVLIVRKVL